MSPEFCLRWNNHRPNLVNVFKELLHHEVLVDVTLAAEGQFIHAHRLVLSACSLYFKELFAVNPCQHPIVILKDFHIADLKTVVEFIYQGEVNVAQERLPNVLKTAESLRIKGLAENPRTFEDYQQQQQQQPQTSNSSATPRLGSQSSQQQSSSLSDSLDQQSVEGEEGPPASPHSPVPPPHKRKRVHAAYEHHDTTPALVPASVGSTEGVRVKEEPVSGNGHQRHSSAAASDAAQTGGSENESTNNRDSPSDKSVGGGGGGGGGGSPTPPPPLSLTPSLSNVSIAPGDSAAPALTPPDCSVPLGQQQGRNRRAVLQRQPGIIRDGSSSLGSVGKRTSKEEVAEDDSSEYIVPDTLTVSAISSSYDSSVSVETVVSSTAAFAEADIPTYGSNNTSLLQVPAVVLASPREAGALPKQVSQPELGEGRPVVHQYGPHPMLGRSVGSIGSCGPSGGYVHNPATSSGQHLQVMQVFVKQPQQQQQQQPQPQQQQQQQCRISGLGGMEHSIGVGPVNLRPIQPKPALEGVHHGRSIKEEGGGMYQRKETSYQPPLIRLTPSEDVSSASGPSSRLPRALSEEPLATRPPTASLDVLGPAPLTQSVSEDTVLDGGSRALSQPTSSQQASSSSFSGSSQLSSYSPLSTLPPTSGHRLALRDGPALGCNFCWNSTDDHGRIQRRKTKYHCPECKTNLCIVPCYQKYHKQMERADDTDKQITKMLTKTSSL